MDRCSRSLGDFTFQYDPGGFLAAQAFVESLSRVVADRGILVTPGNHDVDLGRSSASDDFLFHCPRIKQRKATAGSSTRSSRMSDPRTAIWLCVHSR